MSNGNLSKKKGLLSEINQENLDYIAGKVKTDVDAELENKVDKEEYDGFKDGVIRTFGRQTNEIYELQMLQNQLSNNKLDISVFDKYKSDAASNFAKKTDLENLEDAYEKKADKADLFEKADLVNGKIPSSQLPGYVDDIIEGRLFDEETFEPHLSNSNESNPNAIYVRQSGKLYVDRDTGIVYRWSGSKYVEVSSSLALGETSSTAYSGDKGKQNAENIEFLARYADDLREDKVDKVEGKQLSTEDYTTAEKEKLAELENYDDKQVVANTKKIDYLEKYGESEVIVLTNDEVIIEGNRIVGTRSGQVLNYQGKIVAVPEEIVEIKDDSLVFFESGNYMIYCDKFICPSSLVEIGESTVFAKEIVLSDHIRSVCLDSSSTAYADFVKIELTNSTTSIVGFVLGGEIIAPANVEEISISVALYSGSLYVYNPKANIKYDLLSESWAGDFGIDIEEIKKNIVIHGYGGSTAEKYAKENGYTFVNVGSDYSAELGDIESAVDHILELDNSLLGGGAL